LGARVTDVMLPPSVYAAECEWRIIDNTAVSMSPLNGVTNTFTRPGTRWGLRLTWQNLKGEDRARMIAAIASLRGRSNRVWLTPPDYVARGLGSFPELFTNADFANGTTGWAAQNCTLSVRDRVMRVAVSRASTGGPSCYQSPAVTQYRPLVVRAFHGARSRNGALIGVYANGSTNYAVDRSGLQAVAWTPASASAGSTYPVVYDADLNVSIAGDWIEMPFASLAHCALVDNGPNALLYSDQLDDAEWIKGASTVTVNAATAPDGTTTADAIVENSANTQHYILQQSTRSAVAEDCCAYGYFKQGSGTRHLRLLVAINDVSSYAEAGFNLTAGAATAVGTTGTATNARSFIAPAGNGWFFCAVVSRLPAAAGLATFAALTQTAGGTDNYTGDGASSIYAWRLGAARSSVPTRGALTIATALASGTTQTGSGLYLKGLPASTQNIRAAGDMVEIVLPTYSQLVRLTAALDSDAAGLGYMQFENPVRTSPADNAAVIFNQPMMRCLVSEGPLWPSRPGLFSDFSIDLIEDIAP